MIKHIGKTHTIIEAEVGKYLVIDTEEDKIEIGKPVRIIFENSAEIPEFEELDI